MGNSLGKLFAITSFGIIGDSSAKYTDGNPYEFYKCFPKA